MVNEFLQEIACPNCQNPIDVREHGRHVVCDACSSRFLLNGRLCPYCSTYHNDEELFCRDCGNALSRVCRNCSASNWAGDEYCVQCGQPMDIFDLLALQHKDARQALLQKRQKQIRELREVEEMASDRRMAELRAIEEQRQAQLQERMAKQRQEEKRLLMLALAAVAFFVLIIIVYTAVTLLG